MRIPVPKNSLLTLALVGAVLTGALTVALADPAGTTHLGDRAASWLAPDDALAQPTPTVAAESADAGDGTRREPLDADPHTATADPTVTAGPTTTPAPVATTEAATPSVSRSTVPTPVPDFTPDVQRSPRRAGGEEDEYEGHEGDDDDHDD